MGGRDASEGEWPAWSISIEAPVKSSESAPFGGFGRTDWSSTLEGSLEGSVGREDGASDGEGKE